MDEYDSLYPPINVSPAEICLFQYGKGAWRFIRDAFTTAEYDAGTGKAVNFITTHTWARRREAKGGYIPGFFMGFGRAVAKRDNYAYDAAIAGTPFERVLTLLEHSRVTTGAQDMIDRIDLLVSIAKYPCIEYLLKLGMDEIAKAVISGDTNLLNLRGKTAQAVLRVSSDMWGYLKGKKVSATTKLLYAYQFCKRESIRIGFDAMRQLAEGNDGHALKSLHETCGKTGTVQTAKAIKYCLKNRVPISDYADYLKQMIQLCIPTTDDAMVYPKYFGRTHGELGARIRHIADKEKDKKIVKQAERLAAYWFSALGFTMRPLLSSAEIIAEGTKLHHCVGSYVDRYASGDTALLCVRSDEALDTPLYTVEYSAEGKRIQCRGDHNKISEMDKARLDLFWRLFELYRQDFAALKGRTGKTRRKAA